MANLLARFIYTADFFFSWCRAWWNSTWFTEKICSTATDFWNWSGRFSSTHWCSLSYWTKSARLISKCKFPFTGHFKANRPYSHILHVTLARISPEEVVPTFAIFALFPLVSSSLPAEHIMLRSLLIFSSCSLCDGAKIEQSYQLLSSFFF